MESKLLALMAFGASVMILWAWLVAKPQMSALRSKQLELGADWVTDHIWCPAASQALMLEGLTQSKMGVM